MNVELVADGGEKTHFSAAPPKIVIEPSGKWKLLDLGELWRFRDLLWVLALRDIQVRYKQAVLGVMWAVIQPVVAVVVYGWIFGEVMGISDRVSSAQQVPYVVFLFCGQLPWLFFSTAVSTASGSLVQQANIIRKIYFPRLLIPVSAVGAPLVDFVLGIIVLVGLMFYLGLKVPVGLLLLPVLLVSLIVAVMSVAILLSALTVAYRDFRHAVPFLVQLWFFVTPVLYPPAFLEGLEWAVYMNPVAGPIEALRAMVLGTDLNTVGWIASTTVGMFGVVVGLLYFSRVERRFADVV